MESWSSYLRDHPIFKLRNTSADGPLTLESLDVQASSLQEARSLRDALPTKRRAMVIKNNEVIVAVGKEVRVTTVGSKQAKTYLTLRSPDLDFEVNQISLSPSKKLLAIGGTKKVAIVVLPRISNTKPGVEYVECKSLEIGHSLHGSRHATVAEIGWHPWGEAGASLLVLTSDAKLREYDVSADPNEPVQSISFFSEQKLRSGFSAEDPAAREAVSYSIGQGSGDWSPLTLYAGMRNGDIYAICPFLPVNAIIPSSYLFSLDGFVAAKEESMSVVEGTAGTDHGRLAALYTQQRRYIGSLLSQLPPDVSHTSEASPVYVNSCVGGKRSATRQGPFLLQPAPRLLGKEVDDTTDIIYVLAGGLPDTSVKDWKRPIGMLLIANQDGRVDVCLDLDKVEAQWDTKARSGLPALVVYETIDLQLVPVVAPSSPVPLSDVNHPVLTPDPIHDDIVYVYHALGVHCLDFGTMLDDLGKALSDSSKARKVENPRGTTVTLLTATSIQNPDPIIAVSLPADNTVTSPIIALTMKFNVRVLSPGARPGDAPRPSNTTSAAITSTSAGAAYVSALSSSPFTIPSALLQSYVALVPTLTSGTAKTEFILNPTTIRQLSTISDSFRAHVQNVQVAHQSVQSRASLQEQEFNRQQQMYSKMTTLHDTLFNTKQAAARKRLDNIQTTHNQLLGRMDRILKKLMLRASPELNEHETRWFNELARMKQEIVGVDSRDQESLSAKSETLREEVNQLVQRVKAAKVEEPRRWDLTGKNEVWGTSQASQIGLRSQHGLADIRHLEKLVLDLAAKMDVSLSVSPPPLTSSSV